MAFGKRKRKEQVPPVPAVDWRGVEEFTIGTWERERVGKQPVRGLRAIRVPDRKVEETVYAPCAYFGTGSRTELEFRLYEDAERQRPLCALDEPIEQDGEEVYRVRDSQYEVIGTIRRIPPTRRLVRHTWRIDQPGRPTIVARNKWATKNPKELVGTALGSTVIFLFRSSGDGSYSSRGRDLEWRTTDGEFVMCSSGFNGYEMHLEIEIEVPWLDRRLAFAYAMLTDVNPV